MKIQALLSLSALAAFATTAQAAMFDLSDITNWVGTGANEAALVIDWNDGYTSQAWGFRFDGTATTWDMLTAVAAADSQLFLYDSTDYGSLVLGLGYDRNGGGLNLAFNPEADPVPTSSLAFTNGKGSVLSSDADDVLNLDTADSVRVGWFNGYFGSFVASDTPFDASGWSYATVGATEQILANGSWAGLSWTVYPNEDLPSAPSVVPEPAAASALLGLAAVGLAMVRRRRA